MAAYGLVNLITYANPPTDEQYMKVLTPEGTITNCHDPLLVTMGNYYMEKGKLINLSSLLDGVFDIMPVYMGMPEPSDAAFHIYIKIAHERLASPYAQDVRQEIASSCPEFFDYVILIKPVK